MSFKDTFQTLVTTANGTQIRYTWVRNNSLPRVYIEGTEYKFNKELIRTEVTLPNRKEKDAGFPRVG